MTVPTENVKDVISVRVMRLNRPTFVRQQCEPAELYLDDIAGCLTAADAGIRGNLDGIALNFLSTGNMPTSAAANSDEHLSNTDNKVNVDKRNYDSFQPKVGGFSELLSLPHSFGTTYLGETFSAHVNLHNESNQICYNVELKVALHNRTELITLPVCPSLNGSCNNNNNNTRLNTSPTATTTTPGDGVFDLHPGQSLNAVISHELKELGIHNLRCTVSYFQTSLHGKSETLPHVAAYESPRLTSGLSSRDTAKREPITFQRLYKFSVNKPLDVRKKFSIIDIDHSLLMETQIQNLTTTPMILERVLFEPNPQFSVINLNNMDFTQKSVSSTSTYYLQPNDVQQFLYRLMPTTTNSLPYINSSAVSSSSVTTPPIPNPPEAISTSTHQLSISAGRLDITWRSVMGERGRLQTSSLKYELPTIGDIQLKASSLPPTVTTERPFTIKFELVNCSKTNLDLVLNLHSVNNNNNIPSVKADEDNQVDSQAAIALDSSSIGQTTGGGGLSPLVWLGRTRQNLGRLSPGQCIPFELNLMATTPGLHMVSGVCIHELTMNRDYEFNDLAHVLVFAGVPC
uniref:Trafficking protein particle complex subunit 13 n=2 Tax=Trichobilharzia regenti TaxID=157069 RepID=A0AA85J2H8_TRIRE|nr:unnamed protein product [Trichobilharzia regenti]